MSGYQYNVIINIHGNMFVELLAYESQELSFNSTGVACGGRRWNPGPAEQNVCDCVHDVGSAGMMGRRYYRKMKVVESSGYAVKINDNEGCYRY